MINKIEIDSWVPWKNILFFWAIHWNEKSWTLAINQVIELINTWELNIVKWKITFVPICNPKAYKNNVRYIDENLNRVFCSHKESKTYEKKLANILVKYIDENDILVDLHSTHTDDKPFIFLDYKDEENLFLANSCSVENIISWWPDLYESSDAIDTCKYTHTKWKPWITVECWNHYKEESIQVAKQVILDVLKSYWIIDSYLNKKINFKKNNVKVERIFIKEKAWTLAKNFNHLDKIFKWEKLGKYDNWEYILSPYDWYILLPFPDAKVWDEWFYVWK